MTRISRALSPASIALSVLALVVAASMTSSVAAPNSSGSRSASNVKNNSVTAKKIRNNAVTAPKIRKNAVRTDKIRNGAVTNAKIANGTIDLVKLSPRTRTQLQGAAGPAGADGQQGPAGPHGAAGPAGPAGPAGVSGYEVVEGASVGIAGSAQGSPFAQCPTGKVVIGGGWNMDTGVGNALSVRGTGINPTSARFVATLHNSSTSTAHASAWAVCITAN